MMWMYIENWSVCLHVQIFWYDDSRDVHLRLRYDCLEVFVSAFMILHCGHVKVTVLNKLRSVYVICMKMVFSLSFCACFCSLFCQSVVLWAMLPESSTWMNEWTMSKTQLIHITVIKYNTLRSNTHSKIHKNGNTAQNVITHTLC